MYVIARLGFELTYYDVAVQYISHNATRRRGYEIKCEIWMKREGGDDDHIPYCFFLSQSVLEISIKLNFI